MNTHRLFADSIGPSTINIPTQSTAQQKKKNSKHQRTREKINALKENILNLTRSNESLQYSNLLLQEQCQKHERKREKLTTQITNLKELIASQKVQIQSALKQGEMDNETVELANEISGSFLIFQSLSELPEIPQTFIDETSPNFEIPPPNPTPIPSFTESIIRKSSALKPHFRRYVWHREPTDIEKGALGWPREQAKLINQAARMVQKMLICLEEYKSNARLDFLSMNKILEDIREINDDESSNDWDELIFNNEALTTIANIEFEEPDQSTIGKNPLLSSICLPEKMRNVSTNRELIEKLEFLCSEKKLQLGRSLIFLNKFLQERIESRRISALLQYETEAKELQLQKELERTAREAAAKKEKDWQEASLIARNLLWNSLGEVEKKRIEMDSPCGFEWNKEDFRSLTFRCSKSAIIKYLEKLRSHPDYEPKIKAFHETLEDGLT